MSEITAEHAHGHGHAESPEERARSIDNQKFAMWLYLASEVMIFTIFIGAYVVFRQHNPDAVFDVQRDLGRALVSANTFLLLASSWAMVMGLRSIQKGDRKGLVFWISTTAIMGTIFVIGQWVEYSELAHLGITLESAESFAGFGMRFYAPTAFHGAHVVVGVLWALLVVYRGRKGHYDDNPIGVELFGLYWHFVDVVWILLFTLIYLV